MRFDRYSDLISKRKLPLHFFWPPLLSWLGYYSVTTAVFLFLLGPEYAAFKHPEAPPQYHCYLSLLVDQPQLHLSLDTLWGLEDLSSSIKQFVYRFFDQWKTSPPTMSDYLIESGIIHIAHTRFNFPFVALSKSRRGDETEVPS